MKKMALIFLIFALVSIPIAQAESVPPLVNYQGMLTDATGNAMTGTKTLTFNIYDAATGGNLIWGPQVFTGVPLIGGRFNVILGTTDTAGRSIANAFGASNRFLGIKVDTGTEISPRQQILSTPFALAVDAKGILGTIGNEHLEPSVSRTEFIASGDVKIGGYLIGGNRRSVVYSVVTDGVTTTKNYTWAVPAGIKKVYITTVGGGGGGGGGNEASDDRSGGGGGAGGDYSSVPIDVQDGYKLEITLGKGGDGGNAGSSGEQGKTGEDTVIILKDANNNEIKKLVADGGQGGYPGIIGYSQTTTGSGVTIPTPIYDGKGGKGGSPHGGFGKDGGTKGAGGRGGNSIFGLGGAGGGSISGGQYNGYDGAWGAGGGGSYEGPNKKGGKGGDGRIVIEY